jgi:hypothetical protein
MAIPTGSLFDLHRDRIEEIINKNIDTMMPALDPVWRETIVTNQGVGKASELGRDMKIIKLYRSAVLTGVLDSAYPKNDFVLYGDDTDELSSIMYKQNVNQTWPDPFDTVKSKVFRMAVPMRAMLSNLQMSLGELQAEATPAFIGDVVAPYLKGFAQNLAHTLCLYWYVSQNDNYTIGTVSGITVAGSGPYTATIEVKEKTFDRFYRGQRLDIYNGTTRRNQSGTPAVRKSVYVNQIDELTGKVTLISPDWNFAGVAANDRLTFPNAQKAGATPAFTGIAGVNSWMKFSGKLLGNEADGGDFIDVDEHPEFKSFVKSGVGVLTEHKLRQYLHRFHAAKGKYGQTIDCLIASDGVWLAYEAQKIGQYQLDRTGRLSSLTSEGSQEGFSFTFEGRTYKGYTSNYVEKETVYGIKKGGSNWKRYVPPDPKGVTRFQQADSFIPFSFVMPALTGGSSPKWPITYASGNNTAMITEAVQMPGMLRMQLVPDQPTGMKLINVSEDRVYMEDADVTAHNAL